MNIPNNLLYSKSHEWVKVLDNGNVQVGITDFAQAQMGDVVFFNLSSQGTQVNMGDSVGDMESIKAVSDVYSPISGTIVSLNQQVLDNPSLVNSSPYDAWLIELTNVTGLEALISPQDYKQVVEQS